MATIRLITRVIGRGTVVRTELAPAYARYPLGNQNQAGRQIREITNCPEGIDAKDVAQLWDDTTDLTFLGGKPRLTFDYAELGLGKIIKNSPERSLRAI